MLAPARAATAAAISLSIDGDPDASVRGSCTLQRTGGEEVIVLDGPVPIARTLEGQELTCELTAAGRVVVEIARNGSRSRSTTRDGQVRISVR